MLPTERGRDLDAAVAVEVMGWSEASHWGGGIVVGLPPGRLFDKEEVLRYSASRELVVSVEYEIERRGLGGRFMLELADILKLYETDNLYEQHWRIRRATPDQICIAALAAVRGAKGANHAD